MVFSLLCFTVFTLTRLTTVARVATLFILLALQSLLMYGIFGIQLIVMAPITLFALTVGTFFYETKWYYYALALVALLAQMILIEHYMLHLPLTISYTISVFIANIIIMLLISLK